MRSTDPTRPALARLWNTVAIGAAVFACTGNAVAQSGDPAKGATTQTNAAQGEKEVVSSSRTDFAKPPLVYPDDAGEVLAKVGGRPLTLGDLVDHITARHVPNFKTFLAEPAGQLYFRSSPLVATWVRQFADIVAMESEARRRGVDMKTVEQRLSDTLKEFFEEHLEDYQARRQAEGRPIELNQARINFLLDQFQRRNGLRIELQGWLDFLTEDEPTDEALFDFYKNYTGVFGGRVTLSHILVENRDRRLSRRFNEAGQRHVHERVADIRARLAKDGSNFEELARLYSDDRKTASDGGRLHNVSRFETALPAILCRAAWNTKDGEIVGPIESPYGLHFVKRIKYASVEPYFLPVPENMPRIERTRTRLAQENLVFGLREKLETEILY